MATTGIVAGILGYFFGKSDTPTIVDESIELNSLEIENSNGFTLSVQVSSSDTTDDVTIDFGAANHFKSGKENIFLCSIFIITALNFYIMPVVEIHL